MTKVSLVGLEVSKFTTNDVATMTKMLNSLGVDRGKSEVFDLTTFTSIVDFSLPEIGRVITLEKLTSRGSTYYLAKVYATREDWSPSGPGSSCELLLRLSLRDAIVAVIRVAEKMI